jgi:methyl-accepting chemotaxis protein
MNWLALSAIAQLVSAVAVLVVAAAVVGMGLELRSTIRSLQGAVDQAKTDLTPVANNVRQISDSVRAMSDSLRDDVDRVNETVAAVTERVHHALDVSEERLGEFNALLDVVQDEAERLFVSTASTVRGVRGGARAFRKRGGTDLASDELDAAVEADATMNQEEEDGHDNSPESAAPAVPPAPRVRPRPRHRRRA